MQKKLGEEDLHQVMLEMLIRCITLERTALLGVDRA